MFTKTARAKLYWTTERAEMQLAAVAVVCALALAFTGPPASRVGESPHEAPSAEQVFAAAAAGDLEALQRLASSGGVQARGASELTPLHVAAQHGQRAAAELLLRLGADVNATIVQGASPLHFAAKSGHGDVVRTLLRHGASRELRSGATKITALHYAASLGALDCLAVLVTADTCGLQTAGPFHTPLYHTNIHTHGDTACIVYTRHRAQAVTWRST